MWFRIIMVLLCFLWAPVASALSIDVNTATAEQLEALPGIGPVKASNIINHRHTIGSFTDLRQLDDVSGIGPATMANIMPFVTIESADGSVLTSSTVPEASPTIATEAVEGSININTAGTDVLIGLPGVGTVKASLIVSDRTTNGPYNSCEELVRVRGIGPATVANLSSLCTVN